MLLIFLVVRVDVLFVILLREEKKVENTVLDDRSPSGMKNKSAWPVSCANGPE